MDESGQAPRARSWHDWVADEPRGRLPRLRPTKRAASDEPRLTSVMGWPTIPEHWPGYQPPPAIPDFAKHPPISGLARLGAIVFFALSVIGLAVPCLFVAAASLSPPPALPPRRRSPWTTTRRCWS